MLQSKKEPSRAPVSVEAERAAEVDAPRTQEPMTQAVSEYTPVNEESHVKALPPLNELKQPIIKALREERHSLAAAMEKSEIWKLDGNILSLTFNSPFESTFIEKECREIEGIIRNALGWDIKIKTVIKQKNEASLNDELEEQVELVRDVFRGTIINRR